MGYRKTKKLKITPSSLILSGRHTIAEDSAHNVNSVGGGGNVGDPTTVHSGSSISRDSPLDSTLVDSEYNDDDRMYDRLMFPFGGTYPVDPELLQRQMTPGSYRPRSGGPPPTPVYYNPQLAAALPYGQYWELGYPMGSTTYHPYESIPAPFPMNQSIGRSISDPSITSDPSSRRSSMAFATDMFSSLAVDPKDRSTTTSNSGGSLPRMHHRDSAQTYVQTPVNYYNPYLPYGGKPPGSAEPGNDDSGWCYIPKGFYPVLVPAHVPANAEIVSNLSQVGAILPNLPSRPYDTIQPTVSAQDVSHLKGYNLSKPKKAPRPANSFIIYRREKQDEVMRANEGITNNEASRLIGQMWANEPTDVKEIYKKKAEDAKRLHNITFPDYKYAPRKPTKVRKPDNKKRGVSEDSESDRPVSATPVATTAQSHPPSQQTFAGPSDKVLGSRPPPIVTPMAASGLQRMAVPRASSLRPRPDVEGSVPRSQHAASPSAMLAAGTLAAGSNTHNRWATTNQRLLARQGRWTSAPSVFPPSPSPTTTIHPTTPQDITAISAFPDDSRVFASSAQTAVAPDAGVGLTPMGLSIPPPPYISSPWNLGMGQPTMPSSHGSLGESPMGIYGYGSQSAPNLHDPPRSDLQQHPGLPHPHFQHYTDNLTPKAAHFHHPSQHPTGPAQMIESLSPPPLAHLHSQSHPQSHAPPGHPPNAPHPEYMMDPGMVAAGASPSPGPYPPPQQDMQVMSQQQPPWLMENP